MTTASGRRCEDRFIGAERFDDQGGAARLRRDRDWQQEKLIESTPIDRPTGRN
jgi:hypothetical protein